MNQREIEEKLRTLHYQVQALMAQVDRLTPRPITDLQRQEIGALYRLLGFGDPIIGDKMTVADANATITTLRHIAHGRQSRVIPSPAGSRSGT